MKANEFVKMYGWLLSKAFIDNWSDLSIHYGFESSNLKRLVDSYDLVQSHGGTDMAKLYLGNKSVLCWDALDGQLSLAINDVESCQ